MNLGNTCFSQERHSPVATTIATNPFCIATTMRVSKSVAFDCEVTGQISSFSAKNAILELN